MICQKRHFVISIAAAAKVLVLAKALLASYATVMVAAGAFTVFASHEKVELTALLPLAAKMSLEIVPAVSDLPIG